MNFIGKIVKHSKNEKYYYVLNISTHIKTGTKYVNYIQLYDNGKEYPFGFVWSRDLDEFCSKNEEGQDRFVIEPLTNENDKENIRGRFAIHYFKDYTLDFSKGKK